MLIPPHAWTSLLAAGIVVRPLNPSEVELGADDDPGRVLARVQRRSAPLVPSHVHDMAPQPHRGAALLVVPSASPAALDAAETAGISVLVTDARGRQPVSGHIVLPNRVVRLPSGSSPSTPTTSAPARPGRRPWGALTVVRRLLAGRSATQQELASQAAVSQGRVSQTLSGLVTAGLVERRADPGRSHWSVTDWDDLADWWLGRYPGPGGITTYWFGFASAPEQARTAVTALRGSGVPVAVSGDVAADALAAWRRPLRAVVYAAPSGRSTPVDLSTVGLTPSGPDEATLELTVPADPGVWAAPDDLDDRVALPLADGVQVLWDLQRSPASDTDQAVAALRALLRTRFRAATGQTR